MYNFSFLFWLLDILTFFSYIGGASRENSEENVLSEQEKNAPMTPIDTASVADDKFNTKLAKVTSTEEQDSSVTSDRLRTDDFF